MIMKPLDLISPELGVNREAAAEILRAAREAERRTLGLESFDILKAYGIPAVQTAFAKTEEEAFRAAEEIGYPLVMKVVSPQISHKSDVGGIRLSLKHGDEVRVAYREMMENIPEKKPDAVLEGVQLQQMLSGGKEAIIGMVRDPTFGPMLMFGLGGVYVEILKDVQFAIAPVGEEEARGMVTGIKTYPLLAGARGEKPLDITSLVDAILRVSKLVCDFPEIEEFEINPMMVLEEGKGAFAVDMRLTLKKN
ncbi:TPA: acetyl-CoA synthetase [Methanosarcina acetivorans]|uniref:acetate--CoA ligase (ADP-forming) n=3 Tax=Methanosarcina acetivorans TaxID=2214 RepID=Q8TK22_METAC|nr:acetate-CoA ligase (ADP-forming), subunit beta [Methanosarcina acetivorans C2A]HIH93413.1 acetyl-CoA synthetase [Methanosarcina acetivorans]